MRFLGLSLSRGVSYLLGARYSVGVCAVGKMYINLWMGLRLRFFCERVIAMVVVRVLSEGKLDGDADVGRSDQRYLCL